MLSRLSVQSRCHGDLRLRKHRSAEIVCDMHQLDKMRMELEALQVRRNSKGCIHPLGLVHIVILVMCLRGREKQRGHKL
jgi:hypothetical protein